MKPHDDDLSALLAVDLHTHFRSVVEVYQYRLYVFALRLTGQAQEAEDIVQEAFFHAYMSLKKYPAWRVQTLKLQAWLYKITLHVFGHHARGSRLHLVPFSQDGSVLDIEDSEAEQPEVLLENQERLQELEALVTSLPERYRIAITCFYFEQFSYREIADLLDQPLGTVKTTIYRGIRLLRSMMSAQDQDRGEIKHGI